MKRFKYYNKRNKYTRDEGMTVTVRNNDVWCNESVEEETYE